MGKDAGFVDANLYVVLGLESPELWERMDLRRVEGVRSNFAFREKEIVKREQQDLPSQMSDWRYMVVDIDADEVANRAASTIIATESLSLIPDTLGWTPLRMVRTAMRDILLEAFPDGSRFFPFFSENKDSKELEATDFWYWLPRRYLRFRPEVRRGRDQLMRPSVWGALGGQDTTWEMYHNTAFREFVADLPFWTASPTFNEIVFRPDTYRTLKAAGFTGLYESAADNYLRNTPEQCVGYVHFKNDA
jgi:hypothetical protein